MKNKLSLSIAILFSTFFPSHLFAANLLIDGAQQNQPNNQAQHITAPIPPQKTKQAPKNDLLSHFLAHPSRILWEGKTLLNPHKSQQSQRKVYCIVTDDDTLYLLHKKPDDENAPKPYKTIDLATYGFIKKENNDYFILSSINPSIKKATEGNTLYLQNQYSKPKGSLFHLLRYATHQYYYLNPKQLTLSPLQKKSVLNEKNHQLIQCTCQVTEAPYRQVHMYCLFPKSYKTNYQSLADLLEKYLHTHVLRLTKPTEPTNLRNNENPLYWEYSTERVYSITLSPQINYDPFPKSKLVKVKESTCPYLSPFSPSTNSLAKTCKIYETMIKKDPFAEEKIDKEKVSKVSFTKEEYDHLKTFTHGHKPPCIHKEKCGAFEYIERKEQQTYDHTSRGYIHTLLFYHPRKRNIEISKSKHSPFIYEKHFASMHPLDMREENPLYQLEDPYGQLKSLILEIIENELAGSIKANKSEVKKLLRSVKYITSNELPFLKEVEEKMGCEQHKKLGYPLNIAEMCAIYLYSLKPSTKLHEEQLLGNFHTFPVWDRYLMRAILKLHRVEEKKNQTLYSGLRKIEIKTNGEKGFFKIYTSTSKTKEVAMTFTHKVGMLMYFTPEMQIQFPCCDISWISKFEEEEILFARSADVGIFPAAQWQAFTFKPKKVDNEHIQHIRLSPVAQPLVVRKGKTLELPAAPFHIFSDIKIEENGKLTTEPWGTANEQGGYLYLQCLGDCILGKNAKIDVSKKGYAGGTKQHPQGYGPGGGHGNKYCASGGSHITQGGAAQCEDGLKKAAYYSQAGKTYGKPMHTPKDLALGSGGGCIGYTSQDVLKGSPGGGALYLEVSGNLHVGKNAQLLANGSNAHSLSGGAGSGGSLCVQVKGKLICPNSSVTHFVAQGGNNEQACHPLAQGSGGNGNITVHIAQYEKILYFWFRTYPRNIFLISHTQLKDYTQLITALLLYPSPSFTTPTIKRLDLTSGIPHHVTIESHYYNAKGEDYRKKAQYSEALAYHEKALKLQEEKYGNKAVHLVIAETYGYKGETLAAQGNYLAAIKAHKEELRIAQACYQKTNTAHPKLLKAYTHLSIAHHGQGEDTEAMKYLNKAIQVSEKPDANKEVADVYDTRGLLHRSQANYNQAMQDHQKAADIRKQLYNQKAHSDMVTSCKHIGQTHHAQGDNEKAIASYQDGLKMWEKLYPNQPHHPDGAAIDVLLGQAYYSLGQYKQAITYQEKALISYNKTYAKQNHPDIADTLLRLGQSHDSQGDYNLATYYYKKAIQMLRTVYKQKDTLDEPFHPAMADALEQQGNAYLHFGNATKALQNHEKAYAIRKLAYSDPVHPKRIASYNNIARFHLHQKQYKKALQTVNKGIQIWQQHGTQAAHPIIALTYRLRGLIYYNQTQYALAHQEHKVSLSIHKKLYGEKPHPAIADDHHAIADTYAKEGKYKDHALPYYKKALEIRQKIYHNTPYHPAIAAALTAIGTTYAKIGHSDQAITSHVKATCCQSQCFQKENQIDHTLTLYVHTNASRAKALEEAFPLHPRIQQFIHHTDNTVLLLHGDAGAGKSLYGRFLENDLWSNYQKNNKSIIPLFISLPALKDPTHHAVTETLTQYGWDNATIQALKQQSYHHYTHKKTTKKDVLTDKLRKSPQFDETAIKEFQKWLNHHDMDTDAIEEDIKNGDGDSNICDYTQATKPQIYQKIRDFFNTQKEEKTDKQSITPRLLIFLDGYDEINATQNLYQTNQLAQWGAKVIIDCRTEYLDQLDNYRQYFQADTELYIRPFNTQQIDAYLDRIDTTEQSKATQTTTWHKKQYKEKFEEMPSLKALSTSPFLLQLIVTTLPHLPNRTQITRADIYKTFIAQWITNAINRMEQQGMGAIELEKCWEYARQVGLFMFLHERVTIQTSVNPVKENVSCDHFSDDEKECHYISTPFFSEANTLLRKALPLKQLSKNTSSFLHQSIQEYCAAQALLQSVAQLSPRSPNELTTYFVKKVKSYNPITNKNTLALNQKLLNAAPAIIHFLGDELAPTAQYPAWEQSLFAMIEASKKNAQVAIAAANSATILNAGGILLHDKDWASIHIPYAILDHAFLARTNLQGANLAHVSLRQAYLEDAQLQKANLHNIHFGEYTTLPHPEGVSSVSWSPDGQRLASGSHDKSVRIWEVATGKLLQQCAGHKGSVSSVSWSPDGKRLASASGSFRNNSQDYSVWIWDVATGKLLQKCVGHTSDVESVSWSPDGKRLASASGGFRNNSQDYTVWILVRFISKVSQQAARYKSYIESVSWPPDGKRLASSTFGNDNSVRIWDGDTGKQLQLCAGHEGGVNSVSWSPDGTRLASASWDESVRIWDVASGKQLQLCAGHIDWVNSVNWSPDGKKLASASDDKSVRIWDVATGKLLQQCDGHDDYVSSVSWSPDGKHLASASSDKSVRIWKVATGKPLQQYTGHKSNVESVHWSPDGTRLASASGGYGGDSSVRIWDVAFGKPLQKCDGHDDYVNSVSWSPDGTRLASTSGGYGGDSNVRIWEVATGKLLQQLWAGYLRSAHSVSWSPDGKHLASASDDKSVRIWEVATGKQIQLCAGHEGRVNSVSWSPDGTRLASASDDKSVRIWDVATGKQLQQCAGHTSGVNSVSWSPDSTRLASGSRDKSVRIWEVATGKQLQQFAHTSYISSVSWSPDGTRLASASDDKSVHIWEVATGKQLQQFAGHTSGNFSVSWSPDGTRLASASEDKSVRIWDGATGKPLQLCAGHTDAVWSVSWSPNGKRLASASLDYSVRIWDVATGNPLQEIGGVKKGKVIRIISKSRFLTLKDANFTGAIELSAAYKRLVQQQGGIV